MHWDWKNCPKALQAQFKRHDHKYPTIMLEAVSDKRLWIWHAYFGFQGQIMILMCCMVPRYLMKFILVYIVYILFYVKEKKKKKLADGTRISGANGYGQNVVPWGVSGATELFVDVAATFFQGTTLTARRYVMLLELLYIKTSIIRNLNYCGQMLNLLN
jgi:hypothetical protein